jgi:hypothetical protein
VGSIALAVAGWIDVGLFWIPPHLGNPDWEVGTVGQTLDTFPLGTVALLLLMVSARAMGLHRIWLRLMAALFALISLFVVGCVVLFLLNLPQVLRVASSPGGGGIRRGAAKVLVFGVCYALAYAFMAFTTWRSTVVRTVAEVPAAPAAPPASA